LVLIAIGIGAAIYFSRIDWRHCLSVIFGALMSGVPDRLVRRVFAAVRPIRSSALPATSGAPLMASTIWTNIEAQAIPAVRDGAVKALQDMAPNLSPEMQPIANQIAQELQAPTAFGLIRLAFELLEEYEKLKSSSANQIALLTNHQS
jgi:hypothetical protein